MIDDPERCYRAARSRDPRFDGWFFVGVTSTHIYCRPSCPAMTPQRANMRFYPTAAAAQSAGFRACKRCRPDATPGSPAWNARADLVGRAMRLIGDGVVDRDGVAGLARRLGYSERHLTRQLTIEVGAGPLALARAQRAQTARLLVETTDLSFTELAFAAGFSSIRQFNDTVREVFAATPSELRAAARRRGTTPGGTGSLALRLPYRAPFDENVFAFLGARAVPGAESWDGSTYRRTLRLPHGAGTLALSPADGHVACVLRLESLADLTAAVTRARRVLDLDADPVAVAEILGRDELLGPLVAASPGRRVPGTVDGDELAVRAVLGQQVSVPGARTLAGRLVSAYGEPVALDDASDPEDDGPTHLFPSAAALAALDPAHLAMPESRKRALVGLCRALADGDVVIDTGADRDALVAALVALPGIGPWTASYIALRALGDPDIFLPSDLGVRRALERLDQPADPASAARLAERWRPWRSYALMHIWASLG